MLDVFKSFDPRVVEPRLICLRTAGPLAADYRAAGFRVDVMERRGRFDPRTLPRLVRALRQDGTDAVLVTHHHRASLALGRLAARLAGVPVDVVAVHDMDLTRDREALSAQMGCGDVACFRRAGAVVPQPG